MLWIQAGPVTVLNNTTQRSTFQRLLSVSKHYKSLEASASFLSRYLLKPRCLAMRSPSHREGLCTCALAKSFKLLIDSQHQPRISRERAILNHCSSTWPSEDWSPSKQRERQKTIQLRLVLQTMKNNKTVVVLSQ